LSLLAAPLWIQLALTAEALALVWLVARFGRGGLMWGLAAGLGFWFVLGLGGSFLVGRLEGGAPPGPGELLQGAVAATVRLGLVAWPLLLAGLAAGAALRWASRRRRGSAAS
jgi:hypothetical protein